MTASSSEGGSPPSSSWLLLETHVVNAVRDLAAFIFLVTVATVVAADVVARYFFNSPFDWAQDIASMALLLLFSAAILVATAEGNHVMAEMVHERLPWRMRRLVDALGQLAGAAVLGVCGVWQAYETIGMYRRGEGPDTIDLPYWPVSLAVAVFACLTAAVLLLQAARNVKLVTHGEPA